MATFSIRNSSFIYLFFAWATRVKIQHEQTLIEMKGIMRLLFLFFLTYVDDEKQ